MKTAIVTDSTAYIPEDVRKQHHIHMIPLSVLFGNESYKEEVDISTEDFFDMLRKSDELPKTSQPSIGMFQELYENLSLKYDAVVSIHLSSGISGTYQTSTTAGEMTEDLDVYTFDSEISCMAQGFYVLEAAEMANNGATPDQIMSRLEEMKNSLQAYFMVDDLTNLHRGGRLSGAQAVVGSLLQVKPVLHFVDTKIVPFEKIRTRKKALKRVKGLFEEVAAEGEPMKATIIHANREAEGQEILEELQEQYPHVEFVLSYFGPVIGTHLGEGAIGIGWYKK
ncbi:DegV family protein [Pontibacillus sp. HMF3514]|uniref:DegV family protein n=1 Tax=Pontibacillus sp. HMF3514 TaxID=2692425 RepID=UPI00131FDBF4|nr:DegV family protein [Pontibacillus sp. HMF3514]QHE53603.1 DegV family EDD domain-containing protein [Pontibacillus sp. HMF3514]